jgi:1-deoxy-D-xylulose-5-phosphate synthase
MLTVEQGSMGGFGSIVLQHINKNKSINKNLLFDSMFVVDRFIDQADVNSMYEDAGLGINNIIDRSIKLIERSAQIAKKFDFREFKENVVF